jgi:transcriptional regulator with AAA-type ATPase domain
MEERELIEALKEADLSKSTALVIKYNVAAFNGDVDKAAKKLNTSQATIYRWLAMLKKDA